ncbi:tRNA (adenosine(37)-N6)-threonylcarbamoyltransferase complex ATPase subunit type 1 TsaE [Fodinicola acaciae]|uniref:tRNA (adenosine(37)-N6)-threonylcarbamoyltransferase complex ATPase subunit type 1 TsaE n=1 Tax=Fodinicola acaciae TaxID=2681555 RepID=UPI0013D622D4|nr:tRNA (adenosine(37)-N6)-threonylcarbamoyltransferase complex ATPase subunit type 1 TsaE [Fodinicola acaciae]
MILPTAADTRAYGERLASLLRAGDLVVLTGPLGAGKTALTQGIAAGLGVRGPVTSPTFIMARVHPDGRVPLVHVDAYRLGGSDDLEGEIDALDLDVTAEDAVTVVEWGTAVAHRLAEDYLEVQITRTADSDDRTATLVPHGPTWPTRLTEIPATA